MLRPLPLLFSLCSFTLLATPALAGGDLVPPDPTPLAPAAALHVSAEGLRTLGAAIGGVLPTEIVASGLSGEFDCDEETEGILEYAADDIVVRLNADEVSLSPSPNRLDIHLGMTLWSDPAALVLNGSCLVELDESCTLGLPPTPLNADIAMGLSLVDGQLDAEVLEFAFTHGNFGNPIETGCLLGDALETMNGYGVDLLGTILDQALEGQLGEIETQIEELLGGLASTLAIDTELDLLGTTLTVSLEASQLVISDTGIRIGFDAAFGTTSYGDCVGVTGPYLQQAHDMPALTGLIPETGAPYHIGAVVSADLFNQALYAAWQGGVLCLPLAELVDEQTAGLLSTSFLSAIDEELVSELWPEPQSMDIRLSADAPPTVELTGGPHLVANLNLDVFLNELDRPTRAWGHGLFANAGFDLGLEDGNLIIDVGFDFETNLGITTAYNEWLPEEIPVGFASLLPGLVGQFLDLEALIPTIAIPSFNGLTVSDLDLRVVGSEEDHMGVFAWIDPTQAEPFEIGPIDLAGIGCGDTEGGGDIVIPGCEGDDALGCGADSGCGGDAEGGCGGCGDEAGGCGDAEGGGCSTAVRFSPNGIALLLLPFLLLARRRR